jgi:flagellum-specific peptidoglycan hydrolase FlgJ
MPINKQENKMLTRKQFIDKYAAAAQEVYLKYNIFPQTVLTMAIIESQGKAKDGNYYPGLNASARQGNNYFGIKAFNWNGPTITLRTPRDKEKISKFRKYASIEESFKDYGKFLNENPRYKKAGVFEAPDFLTQMQRIAAAGYAEDPNYLKVLQAVSNKVNDQIKTIKEITKNPNSLFIIFGLAGLFLYQFYFKKDATV